MANPRDMMARFGGSTRNVDFSNTTVPGLDALPTPDKTDTLTRLADKLDALREVVERGHSLAIATGMQATPHDTTDPVQAAIGLMSVSEKEQYEEWMSGARVSLFKKESSREDPTKWRGNKESLEQWVKGLRLMYDDESLTASHAVWWAVHASVLVPTITAHIKILKASRNMTDPDGKLKPEEMAEYQTCKRIQAEAGYRQQVLMKRINDINQRIARGLQAVQARSKFYEERVAKKDGPKFDKDGQFKVGPLNRKRMIRGEAKVGGPSDLGGIGKGPGREKRRKIQLGGGNPTPRALGKLATQGGLSPGYTPQSPTRTFGAPGGLGLFGAGSASQLFPPSGSGGPSASRMGGSVADPLEEEGEEPMEE